MRSQRAMLLSLPPLLLASVAMADISGTWAIHGPVTPVCTFIQTGTSLSGACRGPGAEGPLVGTIDGQTLRWTFTRTNMASGRGIAPLQFSATMNGESLSGTMAINGANPAPFTAQQMPGAPPIQLASARPAPATPSTPVAPASPSINTAPPRTVFDIDADGSATHLQSHLICPASAAGFQRISLQMYGRPGFDVSCGYRAGNAPGSAVVTVYISLSPREPVDAIFELAKASLVQATPGVVARTAMTAAPPGFDWLKAGYTMPSGAATELFLTRLSGWDYKLRATYRPEDAAAVAAVTAALSAGVARTVVPHLARCAAAPAPPRVGQRNRETGMLQALTAATAAMVAATVLPPRSDAVWCAEAGFTAGNAPYVFWRNANEGAGGPVDRITGINGGASILVLRDPPEIVNAVIAKVPVTGTVNNRTVHAVVIDGPNAVQIVGLFDGRPSLNEVASLALQQAVGLYGQVSKEPGNKITVYKPF